MKKFLILFAVSSAIFTLSGCTSGSGGSNNSQEESFALSGNVYGLSSNEKLTLVDAKNLKNTLTVDKSNTFRMPQTVSYGASYDLTILQQPTNETCTVNNGHGASINHDIDFIIVCSEESHKIKGIVEGLPSGEKITLINKGSKLNDTVTVGDNETFEFSQALADGGSYSVAVVSNNKTISSSKSKISDSSCSVNNAQGIAHNATVSVQVLCGQSYYPILYANVSGLKVSRSVESDSVTLSNNGDTDNPVTVATNGKSSLWVIPTPLKPPYPTYNVKVEGASKGIYCKVTPSYGTLSTDSTELKITCFASAITSYLLDGIPGVINNNHIAVTMPYGTDISKLTAKFSTISGAKVNVLSTPQISGTTPNNFTTPVIYTVTEANGTILTYTVTVSAPLFACVADGSNPCGCLTQNDGSITPLVWYGSSLTNNGHGYKFAQIPSVLSDFNSNNHCGYTDWRIPTLDTTDNEAHFFGNPLIDKDFGKLGSYAIANGYKTQSDLATWLNSKGFNLTPGPYWSSNVYTPSPNGLAWLVNMPNGYVKFDQQTPNNLLLAVRGVGLNNSKRITTFSLGGIPGTITGQNITLQLYANGSISNNVTHLKATFKTNGSSVSVNGVTQKSGATPNDFTNPVDYVVTAANGSTIVYRVTVTIIPTNPVSFTLHSHYNGSISNIFLDNQPLTFLCVNNPAGSNYYSCTFDVPADYSTRTVFVRGATYAPSSTNVQNCNASFKISDMLIDTIELGYFSNSRCTLSI